MRKHNIQSILALFAVVWVLSACVTTRPPTVAHAHIGHVLTAWHNTPEKVGLFATAQNAASESILAAESAARKGKDIAGIKSDVARVIRFTDPDYKSAATNGDAIESSAAYGVKNALATAVDHIEYAAISPDVSQNIRTSAPQFASRAKFVLDRCDLATALGDRILRSLSGTKPKSPQDIQPILDELVKITRANESGYDSNGDGVIGSIPEEFGLIQVQQDLMTILGRENPPYVTVDTWYLFNLVRLPSGEWIYRKVTGTTQRGY